MASRTSSTGVVNRGTSGGDSYYVTDVETLMEVVLEQNCIELMVLEKTRNLLEPSM